MALIEGRYFKGAMSDKRHEADGIAAYCHRILSSGVWELGDNLKVSAAGGMSINIDYGYALISGYLLSVIDNNTGPLQLTAEHASASPRIDRVIGIADTNMQRIYPYIKRGTPAASPSVPPLSAGEISLAQLFIAAGSTQITAANITDERADDTVCGLVKLSKYDIGDVYISSKSTSPAIKFGGIWTRIKDRFLLASGDIYTAGTSGGVSSITLNSSNLPFVMLRDLGTTEAGFFSGTWGNYSAGVYKHGYNEGGGQSFSIIPPFKVYYIWERTA